MFGLYDTVGVNFRGSVDELHKLKSLQAIHLTQNDIMHNKPSFEEVMQNGSFYQGEITKDAIQAYRKMAKLDTRHQIFHVRDIMTKNVLIANESQTIEEVFKIMQTNQIKQVPVISKKGNLINLFTKEMILELLSEDPEYIQENLKRQLNTFFSVGVITTDPITDIRRVSKVMIEYSLNALPVVNQYHHLVGIISRGDILKAVANIPDLQIWA